jgi:hypothetical protein
VVDYVQANAAHANFTAEGLARQEEARQQRRAAHEARAVAAKSAKGDEVFHVSSETMRQVRSFRRQSELTHGFRAFVRVIAATRARKWRVLVKVAASASQMQTAVRLGRIVVRMRQTSRLTNAITVVQRWWREKRRLRRNHMWQVHALTLQRAAKRFLYAAKARQQRLAADVITTHMQSVSRFSPLELALRRFAAQVRAPSRAPSRRFHPFCRSAAHARSASAAADSSPPCRGR